MLDPAAEDALAVPRAEVHHERALGRERRFVAVRMVHRRRRAHRGRSVVSHGRESASRRPTKSWANLGITQGKDGEGLATLKDPEGNLVQLLQFRG